jgi:two-component system NtrC family sensor kinase
MLELAILSPVYREQLLLGYIKQTLILDETFLKRLSERMQIQAILLEPNGRIIVGSHPDFLLYKSDFFSEYLKIPKLKTISLPVRGEPFGFVFSKIAWGTSNFEIALAASKKESNGAIENLRVAYYTLLGIMFGVLALSVIAASNVVLRPLSELIEAIQDLHLGENIIELPIKNDNEIGQLTTSFNDLSRRILTAQRELRDKIKELEETNAHLKETQSQLVHSAKMASLGQLVAGVAHELNNPIGFIYSNMSHLRDYSSKLIQLIDAAEKQSASLDAMKEDFDLEYIRKDLPKLITSCEDGARRTKEIVIGLRNFSRLEEKSYGPVDLHQSIDTTLNLLNSEFKNRIELKKDYGSIPKVVCNQTQINQVFMNILSNAAQAIQGMGTVWITTRHNKGKEAKDESVAISIQDSGAGVPPDVLQKIFDPFFTTKTVGQGTGLGLAISYGIINAHGGSIKVTSKVGSGSEFVISLPLLAQEPEPPT